ncbi:cytochrome P450, partial [Melanomma pulvis-pyrius CBS 109.77]
SFNRLVGEVMGIWFGSVHTLSIATTYALLDLYAHTECITPLRSESMGAKPSKLNDPSKLPLLDSFPSETTRLSAFEGNTIFIAGVRRQALRPVTFWDSLRINCREWVCIPHRSMMRDESNFIDVLLFQGYRFFKSSVRSARDSYMTDTSDKWLIWGVGRIIYPGRFYATAMLK